MCGHIILDVDCVCVCGPRGYKVEEPCEVHMAACCDDTPCTQAMLQEEEDGLAACNKAGPQDHIALMLNYLYWPQMK